MTEITDALEALDAPEAIFAPEMSEELRLAFDDFCRNITIDSKDLGPARLVPYMAQERYLEAIFGGLQEDIHWFIFLKARQLGMTTISLALDIFWLSVFPGLQGAIVTDTEDNKEKIRLLITRMLESLPTKYKISVYKHNRGGLVLSNGSSLDYLVAGTRKNGGLGRSRAYNFLHATECSSWGDQEGLESLTKSLTQVYPARLFIFESTARGYNMFWNMWEEAKRDELVKKATFIGWWAKETYSFKRGTKLFERYGLLPPNEEEQEKIDIVLQDYGWAVSPEQLAWYRHESDPAGNADEMEVEDGSIIEQEYPWHEDEAFMVTGTPFFSGQQINEAYKLAIDRPFKGYRYLMGENVLATLLEPVRSIRLAALKVFEEPIEGGEYVVGADPAYGSSDDADRFCVQVFRVYADGMDQVAEFCNANIQAYQFAWVLAHLCGAYNNAKLLLELNGPGEAVFTEMRHLQQQVQAGELKQAADDLGIRSHLAKIRNYMYSRIDAIKGGSNWHWRTTQQNKATIYTLFKDGFNLGQIQIRSIECLAEMRKIVQTGLSIKGEGTAKDDRPMAVALATRAWTDHTRSNMMGAKRTRAFELSVKGEATMQEVRKVYSETIVADFFSKQRAAVKKRVTFSKRNNRWR